MVFSSAMTSEGSCNQGIIVKPKKKKNPPYFEKFIPELMNSSRVTCSERNDPLKANGSHIAISLAIFSLSNHYQNIRFRSIGVR